MCNTGRPIPMTGLDPTADLPSCWHERPVLAENGTAALERARAISGRSHDYDQWLKATQPGHRAAFQPTPKAAVRPHVPMTASRQTKVGRRSNL